jgi:sulfide dehydrogenase cytochrome subunit
MTFTIRTLFVLFVFLIVLIPFRAMATDEKMTRGLAIAAACATCHGPNGHSQGAIPSINTMSAENLMAILQAFRSGERQGTVMNRIAKGLDDAEIQAVAVHLASPPSR